MTRRTWMGALAWLGGVWRGGAGAAGEDTVGKARVIRPKMVAGANGVRRWAGVAGRLGTGEVIGMHETSVPAGAPESSTHRVSHTELIVLLEGTVDYWHEGVTERAEAGAILYVPYGTNHRVKNVGSGAARYLVVQIGGDTKAG